MIEAKAICPRCRVELVAGVGIVPVLIVPPFLGATCFEGSGEFKAVLKCPKCGHTIASQTILPQTHQ